MHQMSGHLVFTQGALRILHTVFFDVLTVRDSHREGGDIGATRLGLFALVDIRHSTLLVDRLEALPTDNTRARDNGAN